jgi:hypothetical protein
MIFERTSKITRGKKNSTIDTPNMLPSKLSSIHKVTWDALDFSIANMEEENARLKERFKELEANLIPPPILTTLVAMIRHDNIFQEIPGSSSRVKVISNLIVSTRHFIEENIMKRMSLILDLWDMTKIFSTLGLRV